MTLVELLDTVWSQDRDRIIRRRCIDCGKEGHRPAPCSRLRPGVVEAARQGAALMQPFPFSAHTGDRELAARLLFEHGLDPDLADRYNPQVIECLAAVNELTAFNVVGGDKRWRDAYIDALTPLDRLLS